MNPNFAQGTDQVIEQIQQKSDEWRLYRCKRCDAVIGIKVKNEHRLKLNVLRNSVPVVETVARHMPRRDFSTRNMEQGDVICSCCGAQRTWDMSAEALHDLLSRMRKRSYGLAEP